MQEAPKPTTPISTPGDNIRNDHLTNNVSSDFAVEVRVAVGLTVRKMFESYQA
jgi:hypothetical protein